jgi:hypothetical protein
MGAGNDMTIDELRRVHKAEPFQPFTLHLADGREFHVPHPEFLYMPPAVSRTVVVSTGDGLFEIVDLLLVTSIELGNGHARQRRRRSR